MGAIRLTDWLSILGDAILIGGLLAAIWQVRLFAGQVQLTRRQMGDQLDWSRKQATFEYLARYRTELHQTTLALQTHHNFLRHDRSTPDELVIESILRSDEGRLQLFEMTYYFEHLAIGISAGLFDERLAREVLGNVVPSTYKSLVPYLKIRRKETGKTVGANFEKLATKWDQGTAESGIGPATRAA